MAEVLITLGVIGVVASLTIPGLIISYQKNVLQTRIKKFASIFKQAESLGRANGYETSMWTGVDTNNPDVMLEFFNVHYAPYMQTISVEKLTRGVAAAFADGSGMYLRKRQEALSEVGVEVIFCVDYRKCALYDEGEPLNSRDYFEFWTDGRVVHNGIWNGTREQLVQNCADSPSYCSLLIQYDGWEIKDDYPW